MKQNKKTSWDSLAAKEIVEKTVSALKNNGISAYSVKDSSEAKKKALDLIPKGSEVMTMTSVTLDSIGLSSEINDSGKYDSVRNKLNKMDRNKQGKEMQRMGSAPEYVVGSVQAVTQDGKLLMASATGSQLPAYVYGSNKVILVVSTQKIVENIDQAMKRVYEHVLPLESERAKKAYGVAGSFVSKVLIFNKEFTADRVHIILVNEKLGF
jgi:hypothetical protein